MSDKMIAGVVAAIGVVPLCAVCILGPAAIGTMLAGVFGWLGGLSPVLATGLAIIFGILTYGIVGSRKSRALRRGTRASFEPRAVSDQAELKSQSSAGDAAFLRPSHSGLQQPNSVRGGQR